jgi:hypothetical protein
MVIKKRPELVFGVKTLDSILFFIVGYSCRAEFDDPNYTDCLDGFEEFVHTYYNNDISTRNWHGLIIKNTQSQEAAVDKFFELLELHLASQP